MSAQNAYTIHTIHTLYVIRWCAGATKFATFTVIIIISKLHTLFLSVKAFTSYTMRLQYSTNYIFWYNIKFAVDHWWISKSMPVWIHHNRYSDMQIDDTLDICIMYIHLVERAHKTVFIRLFCVCVCVFRSLRSLSILAKFALGWVGHTLFVQEFYSFADTLILIKIVWSSTICL